jgi:hypothetical protein
MGKLTLKRLIGAGNALLNGEGFGQVEAEPTVNDGNGQDGSTGIEASRNDSTESKAHVSGLVTISDLEIIIQAHNSSVRSDIINRAWHPEVSAGANVQTNVSDVPLLEGKASYQLSTGEIVVL